MQQLADHCAVGYLKHYAKGRIYYDVRPMDLPDSVEIPSNTLDWFQQYPTAEEELPDDMPLSVFKTIQLITFVDADHASCKATRRSVSGIIHFLQSTPWRCYVGRQKTVEASTYGSESVAARIATEQIIDHRYRLRMMGVPITTATLLIGDNKSVHVSGSTPSSSLSKKHLAISYHKIRETVAAGVMLFAWIGSLLNIADLLTKPLNGMRHRSLTSYWLFGKGQWFVKGSNNESAEDKTMEE